MPRLNVSTELQEVCLFLAEHAPFSALPTNELEKISTDIVISYHRANQRLKLGERDQRRLYIVRSGAIAVFDSQHKLLDKVSVGGYFGFPILLANHSITNIVETIEDSLIYRLRVDTFERLRQQYESFATFFENAYAKRLNIAVQNREENSLYTQQVNQISSKELISITPNASILEAAKLMTEKKVSCLLITNRNDNTIKGILTDRDLRRRVLAKEIDTSNTVDTVMTANPITIQHNAFVDQAILLMIRYNIHHLPVIKEQEPKSILTINDLIRKQRSEPILVISAIYKAQNTDELVRACLRIHDLLHNLIASDVKAEALGRLVTTVTDALTQRLIQLAQQELGIEPTPFTWLAFGSQGRQDQSAKSDQDNALLLDNNTLPEHDEYFKKLANFVCDGLHECGYIHCPGDVMASNNKWRQPLSIWQQYFTTWIQEKDPNAILNSSIFFDVRAVYSSQGNIMVDELKHSLFAAKDNQFFLAEMTRNALKTVPPLGIFNQLVLHRSGEHKDTFNMKRRGLLTINDITRIHALAHGLEEVNTYDRLRKLAEIGALREEQALNLLDALEFVAHMRLVHQGEQMQQGQIIDNYINPKDLSKLLQYQLKDAFQIIRDEQKNLRVRFAHNLPS